MEPIIGIDLGPLGLVVALKEGEATSVLSDALGRRYLPGTIGDLEGAFARARATAEAHVGYAVQDAVLVVPTHFDDAQRQAWKRAAEAAGLTPQRVVNRAAATLLGLNPHLESTDGRTYLLCHLDAGVASATIACTDDGVVEVLADSGPVAFSGPAEAGAALVAAVRRCRTDFERDHTSLLHTAPLHGALFTGRIPEEPGAVRDALDAAGGVPRLPLDAPLDVAALGAGWLGALLIGHVQDRIELTVTDMPFGLVDAYGRFTTLIGRNSTQPLQRAFPFTLRHPDRDVLTLRPAFALPEGGHVVLAEVPLTLPEGRTQTLYLGWGMSLEGLIALGLAVPGGGPVSTVVELNPRAILGDAAYALHTERWPGSPDPPALEALLL